MYVADIWWPSVAMRYYSIWSVDYSGEVRMELALTLALKVSRKVGKLPLLDVTYFYVFPEISTLWEYFTSSFGISAQNCIGNARSYDRYKSTVVQCFKSRESFVKCQWLYFDDKLRWKHQHWKCGTPFDRAFRALCNGITLCCSTPTGSELIASEVTLPFSDCCQSFHTFPTRFLQN